MKEYFYKKDCILRYNNAHPNFYMALTCCSNHLPDRSVPYYIDMAVYLIWNDIILWNQLDEFLNTIWIREGLAKEEIEKEYPWRYSRHILRARFRSLEDDDIRPAQTTITTMNVVLVKSNRTHVSISLIALE